MYLPQIPFPEPVMWIAIAGGTVVVVSWVLL